MSETALDTRSKYAGNPAENYERYFVPVIPGHLVEGLLARAGLQPGESVLDVACGTGIVARRAVEKVSPAGRVAGADPNPAMLAVARSRPGAGSIEWHEAPADALPLADETFDAVLCQLGIQFFPGKLDALREMRRVLKPGGRILLITPGPTPGMFAILDEALARHFSPEAGGFVKAVFSLHDTDEIAELMRSAGFTDVAVDAEMKTAALPAPADFLWQYVYATPLAEAAGTVSAGARDALEAEVVERWRPYEADGGLAVETRIVTAEGRK